MVMACGDSCACFLVHGDSCCPETTEVLLQTAEFTDKHASLPRQMSALQAMPVSCPALLPKHRDAILTDACMHAQVHRGAPVTPPRDTGPGIPSVCLQVRWLTD